MDLHKVTFPTFVLEPRSMLERITDFMSHPDLIFGCVHFHISIPLPSLQTPLIAPPAACHLLILTCTRLTRCGAQRREL